MVTPPPLATLDQRSGCVLNNYDPLFPSAATSISSPKFSPCGCRGGLTRFPYFPFSLRTVRAVPLDMLLIQDVVFRLFCRHLSSFYADLSVAVFASFFLALFFLLEGEGAPVHMSKAE